MNNRNREIWGRDPKPSEEQNMTCRLILRTVTKNKQCELKGSCHWKGVEYGWRCNSSVFEK